MTKVTEVELLSFEKIWDNFCAQLEEARKINTSKAEEMEQESANLTRIDLTEYNDSKTIVSKLEAAVETLDIVRVNVFNQTSKIEIK